MSSPIYCTGDEDERMKLESWETTLCVRCGCRLMMRGSTRLASSTACWLAQVSPLSLPPDSSRLKASCTSPWLTCHSTSEAQYSVLLKLSLLLVQTPCPPLTPQCHNEQALFHPHFCQHLTTNSSSQSVKIKLHIPKKVCKKLITFNPHCHHYHHHQQVVILNPR